MRNFKDDRWTPPRECIFVLPNGKECGVPLGYDEVDYCDYHQKIVDKKNLLRRDTDGID